MTTTGLCGGCRHYVSAAADLEREIAGLKILSSAFGSVRADTGLCRLKDLLCVARHGCDAWKGPYRPNPSSSP